MGATWQRADGPAGEIAVHRRHFHVHEHGVALAGFHRGDGRGAVGGLGNREARALERAPHEQARTRVVIDDEDMDRVHATLDELSSPSSSDSATVRCARSLVIDAGRSEMSPLRAEVSMSRAIAATLAAPRFALEDFSVCAARATVSASPTLRPFSMSASS